MSEHSDEISSYRDVTAFLLLWFTPVLGASDSIHVSRYVSKNLMLTTSVEAICFNYRPKRDNTYPIMLRLTKSGKRKYVSLGISVKEKDWDFKKNQPKKSCPDREAIVKLISDKVSGRSLPYLLSSR